MGYDYSAAKAYEFAEQTSTGFPVARGFQVTASLIGQSQAGSAPADFAMEYGGWLFLQMPPEDRGFQRARNHPVASLL